MRKSKSWTGQGPQAEKGGLAGYPGHRTPPGRAPGESRPSGAHVKCALARPPCPAESLPVRFGLVVRDPGHGHHFRFTVLLPRLCRHGPPAVPSLRRTRRRSP